MYISLLDVSQWYNDHVAEKWVPAADTPPPPSEIRPHAAAAAFSAAPTSGSNSKLEQLFSKLKIHEMTYLTDSEIDTVKKLVTKYQNAFYDEDKGLPAANLPAHQIILDTDKPIRTPYIDKSH